MATLYSSVDQTLESSGASCAVGEMREEADHWGPDLEGCICLSSSAIPSPLSGCMGKRGLDRRDRSLGA